MVRADEVNVAPFTDAPNMIALAAQPSNVDTVVVDGRILKRRGSLTAVETREVIRRATESLAAVTRRAGGAAAAAGKGGEPPAMCC
jgi:5-methylthioadenosine/S-adenosylhomocysteine deaminase